MNERSTVYFEPEVRKMLKIQSALRGQSMSQILNDLVKSRFVEDQESFEPGNLFNADRDNNGVGIPLDDLIQSLENMQIDGK